LVPGALAAVGVVFCDPARGCEGEGAGFCSRMREVVFCRSGFLAVLALGLGGGSMLGWVSFGKRQARTDWKTYLVGCAPGHGAKRALYSALGLVQVGLRSGSWVVGHGCDLVICFFLLGCQGNGSSGRRLGNNTISYAVAVSLFILVWPLKNAYCREGPHLEYDVTTPHDYAMQPTLHCICPAARQLQEDLTRWRMACEKTPWQPDVLTEPRSGLLSWDLKHAPCGWICMQINGHLRQHMYNDAILVSENLPNFGKRNMPTPKMYPYHRAKPAGSFHHVSAEAGYVR